MSRVKDFSSSLSSQGPSIFFLARRSCKLSRTSWTDATGRPPASTSSSWQKVSSPTGSSGRGLRVGDLTCRLCPSWPASKPRRPESSSAFKGPALMDAALQASSNNQRRVQVRSDGSKIAAGRWVDSPQFVAKLVASAFREIIHACKSRDVEPAVWRAAAVQGRDELVLIQGEQIFSRDDCRRRSRSFRERHRKRYVG